MYSEEFYRLALRHLEGYGSATLRQMLRLSGSACQLFTQPEAWRSKMSARARKLPPPTVTTDMARQVEAELCQMEKYHIRLCSCLDADYPYRLKNCQDAPLSFFYRGEPIFNHTRMLAVVGTRDVSDYGRDATRKILSELRGSDVVTVSGLAYGVDTEAHQRSIENDLPTVAVLGNGLGRIYPSGNTALARQIVERGGTVVSEYDFHAIPDRVNFPRRNRIIAGMSDAVLVVETAVKGGSMITAYIAHSYNRDIFAVPGSIFDSRHDGCHELVRKNMAAIVTSGTELLDMMNWNTQPVCPVQTSLFVQLSEEEQAVVDVLRGGEVLLDVLSEKMNGCSPSKMAGILLGLELKGVITCKPGKLYALNN